VIAALSTQVTALAEQVAESLGRHEFGDDPNRYADAKARRNYSGYVTDHQTLRQEPVVLARYARNRRLADALHQQAFAALNASLGARAFYDAHRARGNTHHQALRVLGNKLTGVLHGCLDHHQLYDELIAWAGQTAAAAA